MPYQPRTQTMPEPEHSQYLNTQSMKVNAGLDFGRANNETKGLVKATSPDSILDSNAPVLNIDFRDLRVPAQIPIPIPPMAEELIPTLLHPPPHAFLHGVLSMQWVMGALGQCHFHFRSNDERYVLAPDSTVRTEGAHLGLPPVYLEWLCGDEEESSPTEQGMHLTPRFFEELREGKGDKSDTCVLCSVAGAYCPHFGSVEVRQPATSNSGSPWRWAWRNLLMRSFARPTQQPRHGLGNPYHRPSMARHSQGLPCMPLYSPRHESATAYIIPQGMLPVRTSRETFCMSHHKSLDKPPAPAAPKVDKSFAALSPYHNGIETSFPGH
ncbi:hypothetical protein EKO04_009765 [Ascochyta lentis]|uniref:Uncharacterized protein n=1 Tax=Ascochyta lentis TaxID=205686 RepID=A0A8H7MGN8_9PLEO|nr:hypothetical protein EKO04_009765 [Ascochyta lentis]